MVVEQYINAKTKNYNCFVPIKGIIDKATRGDIRHEIGPLFSELRWTFNIQIFRFMGGQQFSKWLILISKTKLPEGH
jgi:hypothetical protein